ncbi:hypothetical protein Scep_012593 [Stephania cephalantha]|uniref:Uncharacterized protein n=1 Tax=Stephania cephalantha TaxID=152367 RepID=A0AAP0JHE6_9MAGN
MCLAFIALLHEIEDLANSSLGAAACKPTFFLPDVGHIYLHGLLLAHIRLPPGINILGKAK